MQVYGSCKKHSIYKYLEFVKKQNKKQTYICMQVYGSWKKNKLSIWKLLYKESQPESKPRPSLPLAKDPPLVDSHPALCKKLELSENFKTQKAPQEEVGRKRIHRRSWSRGP